MPNFSPPVVHPAKLTGFSSAFDIGARLVPGDASVECVSVSTSGGCCYPPRLRFEFMRAPASLLSYQALLCMAGGRA